MDDVRPIAIVGVYKDTFPCASLLKDNIDKGDINPILISALCVSLFESCMHLIPDSEQLEFEQHFQDALKVMLRERHKYTSTFDINNEL
jgi:hypothetical protein